MPRRKSWSLAAGIESFPNPVPMEKQAKKDAAHSATTEIYTYVSIVKPKQIYKATHPVRRAMQRTPKVNEVTEEELLVTPGLEAEEENK